MPRLLAAVAGLVGLTVIGVGASATAADDSPKAKTVVIDMLQDGKQLYFEGPKSVAAGDVLKIKNSTDPRKAGPHTFSLVARKDIPTEPAEIKKCGKKLAAICGAIVEWHDVNLQTGEFGINPVEAGEEGWDTEGTLKRTGDSWASVKKNETFKQNVTAEAGTTLNYFCAVHPDMSGKIKVEG